MNASSRLRSKLGSENPRPVLFLAPAQWAPSFVGLQSSREAYMSEPHNLSSHSLTH